ncbi:MAG: DMT family transporter [Thermoproteota archaeon]|nr:DMT family transporter [Thermoproteota archaeon]MDQ5876159.1 DMT family transporter [Thermoproteota archaeon]
MVTEKGEESHRQPLLIGYLAVLFAALLFGSVFSLAKVPLATIDPLALTAVVYTISGLSLIPFAKGSFAFERSDDYFYVLIVTIFGGVLAPVLLMYGLEETAASTAAILTNGEIVFTIALSSIFFGEKPHGRVGLFAVILVVIGLFIATTEDLKALESIVQLKTGNIMILAAMFMWAIDNNVSRRLTSRASPAKIAMVKSLAGGLVLIAIALALGKGSIIVGIKYDMWILIVGMSIAGFGGALLLFLEGIKRIGTVRTMSMFSLTPVFGLVIAALALGESITVFQGIATGLIILGIILIGRH